MTVNKGGRPSPWISSSKTRLIRVPEHMADEILEIARLKDKGEDISFIQNPNNRLNEVLQVVKNFKSQSKSSRDWTKCNQLIQELENEINRPQ